MLQMLAPSIKPKRRRLPTDPSKVARRAVEEPAAVVLLGVDPEEEAEPEEECCPICFEELASCSHLETRAPGGWGHTRCCGQPLHYACLYKWINDNSTVDSSSGPVELDTGCPMCRSTVSKSKSRMLGPERKVR